MSKLEAARQNRMQKKIKQSVTQFSSSFQAPATTKSANSKKRQQLA